MIKHQHLVPLKDKDAHIPQTFCKCKPHTYMVNGNFITKHNAFDKREAVEEAQRIAEIKHVDQDSWGVFLFNTTALWN